MKIYLYYDKIIIPDISVFSESIIRGASTCFRVNIPNIEPIIEYPCGTLKIGGNTLNYYCVIDEKIDKDALRKKEAFANTLHDIFAKQLKCEVIGTIKIETGYTPLPIKNSSQPLTNDGAESNADEDSEFDYSRRAKQYTPVEPAYTFNRVILPESVLSKIEESLNIIQYEEKVFNEWGLYAIQPNPSSALSFFGPSGTGKTMAAEAIADKLHKKILKVSYADIESKFHGEGPKMIKAIFMAAQAEDAVLFIDEADSLLSKRLTNVTQGSEQAINSMRSQLLICLEQFHGIVIFATNLVVNYDQAFLTRLISIEFVKPDQDCRKRIWDVHIYETNGNKLNIPLADDVNTQELASMFNFCGREIRKSVISACVKAAMNNQSKVTQNDFIIAAQKVLDEEASLAKASDHTISVRDSKGKSLSAEQSEYIASVIKEKMHSNE